MTRSAVPKCFQLPSVTIGEAALSFQEELGACGANEQAAVSDNFD